MITVTRSHFICMGHRVYGHEGKCKNLHGHNYKFEMTIAPKTGLDKLGRVIDFSAIKSVLGKWLEIEWDHKMVLWEVDPLVSVLRVCTSLNPQSIVSLPVNPTAENIAAYFVLDVAPILLRNDDVELVECTLYETEKCCATYVVDHFVSERIKVNAESTVGNGR